MRAARDLAEMAAIFTAVGLFGFLLVRSLRDLSRMELAAWSWIAGLLTLAGAQAVVVLLRLGPGAWKVWALVAAAALVFRDRAPRTPRTRPVSGRIGQVAAALALAAVALFCVNALSEPMWAWDYVAIWGLKGKTIFFSGVLPPRFFRDPELAFLHPSYPLLLPLLFAGLSTLAGGWDPQALALLYPAFEAATLLLTWGFLRRRFGTAAAAAATLLTAGFFTLYQSFLVGLADIPMSLGFLLAGSTLLDALEGPGAARARPLLLAALFCCGLKKEGAIFLLLLAAALALLRIAGRRPISLTPAAIFAGVPIVHQAALRALRGPTSDTAFRWAVIVQRGASLFARRIEETAADLLHSVILPALPSILAILLILLVTRRTRADLLFIPMGTMVALYAAAPAASAWSDAVQFANSTFVRITIAFGPLFFLVLGARMSEILERFSLRFARERPTMN